MNRRQKAILVNILTVTVITTAVVVVMANFRVRVNHSEAMRAMEHLGRIVLQYRQKYGLVPPESYVDNIREELEGYARLGDFHYRARWIDFECPPDEILAYAKRNYHSLFFEDGFIVLRLDGKVEWMSNPEFEKLLAGRQSPIEIQMLQD